MHLGEGLDANKSASKKPQLAKGTGVHAVAQPRKDPAPRPRLRQRAAARIRDARAPAAGADRGPGRGGGAARLHRRSREAAPRARRLRRQRARQSGLEPRRGREADRELPARAAARRDPCAVLRPRGGDRRQRAGRDVRRAREPRRLFPAGAGHDALRRGQLHLARHRQGARPLRDAPRPGRRRGRAQPRRRQQKRGHDALDAYCVNLNKKAQATARSIR